MRVEVVQRWTGCWWWGAVKWMQAEPRQWPRKMVVSIGRCHARHAFCGYSGTAIANEAVNPLYHFFVAEIRTINSRVVLTIQKIWPSSVAK